MSCSQSLSLSDEDTEVPASTLASPPDSLPTFQMFREKKAKVEEELRYDYRVRLGGERQVLPWLAPLRSSIEDWSVVQEKEETEEILTDLLIRQADRRVSVLLTGRPSTGKTSLVKQLCLDWARGAAYLQHFNLVLLIDCANLRDDSDLDKHIMKAYKMFKIEKLNLHKWEVQKESFLLALDNFSKLSGAALETVKTIITGETYSQCSVIATAKSSASVSRGMFDVRLRLEGWREEVVMEVIHRHFSHSPNKVLALKLKLSHNETYKKLLRCPFLAQLACLAYEDTGELPTTSSESLQTMMRTVFSRELYSEGRTLHLLNYSSSLVSVGERCLHSLARGRTYLRTEEVSGLARRYSHTLLGFLRPAQVTKRDRQKRDLYEPLHTTLMEFTAAFYLKSLSDKNQQDRIGEEVDSLCKNNSESLENVLTFALEMLAPDNACSDILSRLPRDVLRRGGMRLLQTAGYTHQNIGSVLAGLGDHQPVLHSSQHEVQGWTRILDFRPDLFRSVEIYWTSSCQSLASPGMERLFQTLSRTSVRDLALSLSLRESDSPGEELRHAGNLLGLLINSVHTLKLRVSDGVNVFPVLESLCQGLEQSASLTSLSLDMELTSTNLSLIASSLQRSEKIHQLRLTRAASGSQGFKQLQQLLRSGKIKLLEISTSHSAFDYNAEDGEADNQYVYEEEALMSEESKLRKLSPLLTKICKLAGLTEKELSPVEIVSGVLHPCLRYGKVYPAPLCPNHRTGAHYVCQALTSNHVKTDHLSLTFSDPRDVLCVGEALVSNSSLRSLTLRSSPQLSYYGQMEPSFPLLVGVSCHLGLTHLDLSGLRLTLHSESLELGLAALSSNTALSLAKVSLAGWTFCCQLTEKTNVMQAVMEVMRTSRISWLDLSQCSLQLSCNQRLFTLYFELEEQDRARSLWQEIHDDKISSAAIRHLDMEGFDMTINNKQMLLPQELSMLDCPNIEVLNLSARSLDLTKPPDQSVHLRDLLENLPTSLTSSVQRLVLDNYCLYQNVPSSQIPDLREVLGRLRQLRELGLSGCRFSGGGGKEEILKSCLELIPQLDTLHLNRCHLNRQAGVSMGRVIKARAKRGSAIKIGVAGSEGEGREKMMTVINLSKFVVSHLDSESGVMTTCRVSP